MAIVTGGASGLGEATVRDFAAGGGKVAILDMNASKGEALCAELGERSSFHRTDVTDAESVGAAIDAVHSAHGKVNICVNCAGIGMAMKTMGKGWSTQSRCFQEGDRR